MADWRSPLMSAVSYRDPRAALAFLEAAFGFEVSMLIEDDAGNVAHCERARSAGMEIIAPLETQFYGDRTYRARDPEGHIWTVGQTVQATTREEAEKATGLKITGWV